MSFDANGEERDRTTSENLLEMAASENISNIFLFSHGWMGDVPAAVDQYDRWIGRLARLAADSQRAAQVFPSFHPLYIGLHWPSLPWGDEELEDGSFGGPAEGLHSKALFEAYLGRLGDTPDVRTALYTIIDQAQRNAAAGHLSTELRDAFLDLHRALDLRSEGATGAPDADCEPFDPDAIFEADGASFGAFEVFGGCLGLLRFCSFWTMKKRARKIGEGGMHSFIKRLQQATQARIHLMGHSFGCIVISSILAGPGGRGMLERPIDSVALVQGAVSLWSYAPLIPFDGGGPGYFHRVLADGRVAGPLITTRSRFDTAVGRMYPAASALSVAVSFAAGGLPRYGAIGAFGLQGLSDSVKSDATMLKVDGEYEFVGGRVYNLEASPFISHGGGSSGAHNDIDGPEVAHAIWQAALSSAKGGR
jgi:hypothetical protein